MSLFHFGCALNASFVIPNTLSNSALDRYAWETNNNNNSDRLAHHTVLLNEVDLGFSSLEGFFFFVLIGEVNLVNVGVFFPI